MLSSTALLAGVASAQPQADARAAAPQSAGVAALDEIVVTSRRQAESLQTTPLSVVVVTDEQIASLGADNLKTFDVFVPNLSIGGTMGQGASVANFSIRGVGGASSGFITQESAVAVYVDDVLLAHPNGALLDMLDVQQLEVLRGPQGTLFGRNTAGGAIRYTSKKPDQQFGGRIKGAFGENSRVDLSGVVNLPVSETFAMRAAYSHKTRDGYIERLIDGEETGDENTSVGRLQFRWQPGDKWDVNLSADYVKNYNHGTPTVVPAFSPTDLFIVQLYNPMTTAASLAARALTPASVTTFAPNSNLTDFPRYLVTDRYKVFGGQRDHNEFKAIGAGLNIEYRISDALTFKSLTGFNDAEQAMKQDWDRTPIVLFALEHYVEMKYITQEFQLLGRSFDDRLKWVTGVFYFDDESSDLRLRTSGGDGVRAPEGKDLATTSIAVFGQGTFDLSDRFSITAGLRWNQDEKDYTAFRSTRNIINGQFLPYTAPKSKWTSVSPRLGFEQRWTDTLMTYISGAKGFKAGGLNDTLTNSPGTTVCSPGTAPVSATNLANCGLTEFKPENLRAYEIGLRSEFLDRRVRLNVTGFFSDYKNMQVQLIDQNPPPVQYNINADAEIKGLEVDFAAAVTDRLMIRAGFGYTDAEYGDNILAQTLPPPPRPQFSTLSQQTPLLRSPKTSYTISTNYRQPLANDSEFGFDLNYGWKDEQASTSTPTNMVILPSYGLLNTRLTYKRADKWSVSLYGNNLTDEYYLISAFDPAGPNTKFTYGSQQLHDAVFGFVMHDIGRPREIGIEFSWDF